MNKPAILKQLMDYFNEKGVIYTIDQYKAATDAPMRFMVAKRAFGSWARMTQMINAKMAADVNANVAPVVKAAPKPKAKPAPKKAEVKKGK
jgi:hypothetical protein